MLVPSSAELFLGQQVFVEGLGVIVVAGEQVILLLDARAHGGAALVDANLALQLLLVEGGLFDHALVLVNLQTELANFRRFGGVGLFAAVGRAGGCGRGVDLFQLLLDLGDVGLGFDHVGVIVGVARLQLQQLRLQLVQLLFEGLRIGSGLRTLPGGGLLRQHAFGVGLILLGAAQGLGGGIELRIQRHQHAHVVVGVAGQADPCIAF